MIQRIEHGEVVELRLDRPPVNALSLELIAALDGALKEAVEDGAGAIVLSGREGVFSAGLDLPSLLELDRDGIARAWRTFYSVFDRLATSPAPVAAALTGHSPAGGTVLALFCDWRVMADGEYKIGLNEVQVGLPVPPILHRALKRLVGPRQAERLAVGALLIEPREAHRLGLVDALAPLEEVVPRALAWCDGILALPRHAMRATREMARRDLRDLVRGAAAEELDGVLEEWFRDESQRALHATVDRIKKRA